MCRSDKISTLRLVTDALCKAKQKHPEGLGSRPYDVIQREVLEVHAEFVSGDAAREREELLDIIAPCIRRLEAIAEQGVGE